MSLACLLPAAQRRNTALRAGGVAHVSEGREYRRNVETVDRHVGNLGQVLFGRFLRAEQVSEAPAVAGIDVH